jgi:hypothetical protein
LEDPNRSETHGHKLITELGQYLKSNESIEYGTSESEKGVKATLIKWVKDRRVLDWVHVTEVNKDRQKVR